ncbi:hypothetical protein SmJEL517_g02312 [Synchytrium microbalum]|uniref:non-specific serine/threonine protein kinase n=1 Tax=Synchytrium microbalum TaxID=1806994 RepID=A0A507CCM3_9FUNG|nr:uncharacterized protein SmJEL517_g02312 [Synchytrium microbalum]TPX35315.1 hypothetical protein SmJEL517_g02312 [Synchytrium microbalum]
MNFLSSLNKNLSANITTNKHQIVQRPLQPPPVAPQQSISPGPPGTYAPNTILTVGERKVVVEKFLAEGGYAHVYVVVSLPDEQAVLKRIACPDEDSLLDMRKEITWMKLLSGHKNIVTYYDSDVQPLTVGGGGYEVFILMEYCTGGHLVDFLNTRLSSRLTEAEVLTIFSDICEAVAHMHYADPPIIHRDLKIENVLIATNGKHKVCDFGSATTRMVLPNAALPASEIRLLEEEINKYTTLQYRSPEMCDLYSRKGLTEKTDMWALGVLLYKLCYFTTPFEDGGKLAILNGRYTMPNYPVYSQGLIKLIDSMLLVDVNKRANIFQVYSAVCKLRNGPCFLQNKYPDAPPLADIQAPLVKQVPLFQSRTPVTSQYPIPLPPTDLPPDPALTDAGNQMRRGRPPKQSSRGSSQTLSGFLSGALNGALASFESDSNMSSSNSSAKSNSMSALNSAGETNFYATAGGQIQRRGSQVLGHPPQPPLKPERKSSGSIDAGKPYSSDVSSSNTSTASGSNPFDDDAFNPFRGLKKNTTRSIPDLKVATNVPPTEAYTSATGSMVTSPTAANSQSTASQLQVITQQQQLHIQQQFQQMTTSRGHLRTHSMDSGPNAYNGQSGRPRSTITPSTSGHAYSRSEGVGSNNNNSNSWVTVQTVDINHQPLGISGTGPIKPHRPSLSISQHNTPLSEIPPPLPTRPPELQQNMNTGNSSSNSSLVGGLNTFRPTHSAPSSRMGSAVGVVGVDPNQMIGFLGAVNARMGGGNTSSSSSSTHGSIHGGSAQQSPAIFSQSPANFAPINTSNMASPNNINGNVGLGVSSANGGAARQSWAPSLTPSGIAPADPYHQTRASWAPGTPASNNPFLPNAMTMMAQQQQLQYTGNSLNHRASWVTNSSSSSNDPFGEDFVLEGNPVTSVGPASWVPLMPSPGGPVPSSMHGKDNSSSSSGGWEGFDLRPKTGQNTNY